jgi:CubicO group peptidase (beta-lactamase class C family)
VSSAVDSAIDEVLAGAVAAGDAPNVVAMAADADGVTYEGAAGPRVAGGESGAVTPDSVFRIMSMTKMVGTVAALQLVEQGRLDLDRPVADYCPEFARVQVLTGFDGDTPTYREPAAQATVKHLATHTSGLSYWFWNKDISKWEQSTGTPNVLAGRRSTFTAPMIADPGTRWEYGINTDWLGQVVERASGRRLDEYFAEHITGPLGMTDTTFKIAAVDASRLVPIHIKGEDGTWSPTDIDMPADPEYYTAGNGLYSTPRDYLRFQRMLLGNGTLDGTQVLRPDTVEAAFTNQIGDIPVPEQAETADPASSFSFTFGAGQKWGYGLLLNTVEAPGMRAAGSGAWAGLCNSHYWIDRTNGVTGAIYSQSLPFVPPEQVAMYQNFERALYARG